MAKALKFVGTVAGVVALAASVAVTAGATAPILGASLTSIASVASATAAVASVGSSLLASKPPARGSVNAITIGSDQPMPYLIGRTYYGGSRQQQVGYGPTKDKVPNPYLLMVDVYSGAGPVAGLEQMLFDFVPVGVGGAIGGYFAGFAWATSQVGAVPEANALAPHWQGAPGWDATSRLSGYAAIAWSLLFDKNGKVFSSGAPQTGAIWRGQLCYDPRKDSTYPGGNGPHRWTDPRDTAAHDAARATWEYSDDPGLNALRYALGVYHRDPRVAGSGYAKVFGCGIPIDGLIVDHFVHLANVCQANGWTAGGVIFEPGNRWTNLKDILAAGGAEPAWVGGRLGLKISAPRVALDTITADDLADETITVGAMQGWEDRLNTLVPKVRSEDHKWEYVQATNPVRIAAQVVEDGEEKKTERQINLCQDFDQGAQLCAYELLDRRELGDIVITAKPRLRRYGAGDLLIVDLPEAGLIAQPCVVMKRTLDPTKMTVQFVLRGETAAKHDFALGRTGIAPLTPALLVTADRDALASGVVATDRAVHQIVRRDVQYPLSTNADTITITAFRGTLDDARVIDFPAAQVGPIDQGSSYAVFYAVDAYDRAVLGPDGQAMLGPDGAPITTLVPAGSYIAVKGAAIEEAANGALVIMPSDVMTAQADGTYPPAEAAPAGDAGSSYGGGSTRSGRAAIQ